MLRLPFLKEKELYVFCHHMLGFYPGNIELYKLAFVHRSMSTKSQLGWVNNERLEFLGDSILDSIVADVLYNAFPKRREGFLTSTRSKIVQRESGEVVAKVAEPQQLHLWQCRGGACWRRLPRQRLRALLPLCERTHTRCLLRPAQRGKNRNQFQVAPH